MRNLHSVCLVVAVAVFSFPQNAIAQLNIQTGGKVNIQSPAVITVTGNVTSTSSIGGNGTVLMRGSGLQQLNLNSFFVPNLTIQNAANVMLISNAQANGTINLLAGKIVTGAFAFTLGPSAIISGAGAGKFIETGNSGQVRKLLAANVTNYLLPVGNGINYTPLTFTTSGTYSVASLSVTALPSVHPDKPASVSNFLNTYWKVTRTGITGSVNAISTYNQSNVSGNEALIIAFLRNGSVWTKSGTSINRTTNQLTAGISGSGADMYAMNDFAGSSATLASESDAMLIKPDVVLYPNPASKQSSLLFGVSYPQIVNIIISDNRGRVVKIDKLYIQSLRHEHSINLSGLAPGVYNVELKSVEINKSVKLVKIPG